MSVIEESRKVMQDFLAPELRAISARLDALEKRLEDSGRHADKRLDDLTKRVEAAAHHADSRHIDLVKRLDGIDHRGDRMEDKADRRHQEIMQAILKMIDIAAVNERLAKLEAKNAIPANLEHGLKLVE
jgi:tetrahydromethanopterin S-methyltransferase subunit G